MDGSERQVRPHHLLAGEMGFEPQEGSSMGVMEPWEYYLVSLCLSFFCKMGIIMILASERCRVSSMGLPQWVIPTEGQTVPGTQKVGCHERDPAREPAVTSSRQSPELPAFLTSSSLYPC